MKIFRLNDTNYTLTPTSTSEQLISAFEELKAMKRTIFLELNTESFGCCNDYLRCSDALKCLHSDDRFYNNCMYRKNLEAGNVFYGRNRNV